jgi:hypothetical protein
VPLIAMLWDLTNNRIVTVRQFRQDPLGSFPQWVQCWVHPTFRVDTSHNYRMASVASTFYQRTNGTLVNPVTHGQIQFVHGFQTTALDPTTATITNTNNANGMDVLFQPD